jgi:hypothetical protein
MARKRTSLASLLDDSAAERPAETTRRVERSRSAGRTAPEQDKTTPVHPDAAAEEMPSPRGRRAHVKQQTVYLPLPVYEQLRRLAFEERTKMHSLLMEGLDRVFRDRGLSSLADLERQQDA